MFLRKIRELLGLLADAAHEAQPRALALHRLDDAFAPAPKPDDRRVDHRCLRRAFTGNNLMVQFSHAPARSAIARLCRRRSGHGWERPIRAWAEAAHRNVRP